MASSVCVSRCRMLIKLDLSRAYSLSPFINGPINNSKSWCRRFRTVWSRRFCTSIGEADSSRGDPEPQEVTIGYRGGLPQLTVPLPSRRERCRFTLRPLGHTVGDLLAMLRAEDRGIDRAQVTTAQGVRLSSSDTIESLFEEDFRLIVNDNDYYVKTPKQERLSQEELERLSDVRNLVNQLYAALNVGEHQLKQERLLRTKMETLKQELMPLEEKRSELELLAIRRTNVLTWLGLGLMGVQFGVLARLTWWEYSWDIMEPVTYFVTYGTAMGVYAYFVLTKQEYILPDVKDRLHLIAIHKHAKKLGMDVDRYNSLKDQISKVEIDLKKLRDPLHNHMPPSYLAKISGEDDFPDKNKSPLAKLKSILEDTSRKLKTGT